MRGRERGAERKVVICGQRRCGEEGGKGARDVNSVMKVRTHYVE